MGSKEATAKIWGVLGDMAALRDPKFTGWKPSQQEAFNRWNDYDLQRMLLHFPTGEGKSMTALGLLRSRGYMEAVIVAPLKTHQKWKMDASMFGMNVRVETHEMFRQMSTKHSKTRPIIIDEFHKLGGRGAVGFEKCKRRAKFLEAPMLFLSATPNYNDAERCFILQQVCDPDPKNNYLMWLNDNCNVVPSRYSMYPDVDKVAPFKKFRDASEFLRQFHWCAFVEDTAQWDEEFLDWREYVQRDVLFDKYGLYRTEMRMMDSLMETRHKRVSASLVTPQGYLVDGISAAMQELFESVPRSKWMVYCTHVDVADAVAKTWEQYNIPVAQIDGRTKNYESERLKFVQTSGPALLVGTSAIAEGVDGIDKVCQSLLFLDDIDGDDAKRRQVIGRILSRGTDDGITRIVRRVTY